MARKKKKAKLKKAPPSAAMRGRVGKPRRGKTVAKVSTVRIDDVAKEALQLEFGSLGNALYYLYEGIHLLRREKELRSNNDHLQHLMLNRFELERCFMTLSYYAKNKAKDGREARPYKALALKIYDYIFGDYYNEKDED